MKKEFVRNPYNYDSDAVSTETGLLCIDETLTEQQHIEDADINIIADRFMRTGELPQLKQMPTSGDFSGTFDFQSSMNLITEARNIFMDLPAKIRTRFGNDPAQLIEFMEDPENRDEATKMGFIQKPATIAAPTTTGATDETRSQGSTHRVQEERAGTERTTGDAGKTETTQESRRQTGKGDRGGNRE